MIQGDAGELCQHPEDGRPKGSAEEVQAVYRLQAGLCGASHDHTAGNPQLVVCTFPILCKNPYTTDTLYKQWLWQMHL